MKKKTHIFEHPYINLEEQVPHSAMEHPGNSLLRIEKIPQCFQISSSDHRDLSTYKKKYLINSYALLVQNISLVRGFNHPFEKYARRIGSFPQGSG